MALPVQPRLGTDSEGDPGLGRPGSDSDGAAVEPGAAGAAVPDGRRSLPVRSGRAAEAEFARMGKAELRRRCLPDYKAVRVRCGPRPLC